jgi:hypothetical protein
MRGTLGKRWTMSEESKKRMSKARMGNHNALGSRHNEETKRKISNSVKEKWKDKKFRIKMSNSFRLAWKEERQKGNTGHCLSDETKRKISSMLKGKKHIPMSEKTKRKLSEVNMGHFMSKETKRKISLATKGKNNPNYGKHHSDETRRKISLNHANVKGKNHPLYGKYHSKKTRRRLSDKFKEHQNMVLEEIENLNKLGYKTLNGDLKPKPDIFAFRDGKIYAYEIETKSENRWNTKKYNGVDFFDDVIWIKRGE